MSLLKALNFVRPHCDLSLLLDTNTSVLLSHVVCFPIPHNILFQVFDTVLEEVWYQPDTSLYAKMIECLGQSCETQQAQILFDRMVNEGMQPVQSNFTALIGAYCIAGNYAKGIELLRDMQSKGIAPTRYTYERIVQGCKDGGAPLLAEELRREMEVVVEDYERKPIITRKK